MYSSCSESGKLNGQNETKPRQNNGIPNIIITVSDSFIISKTGVTFFNKFIKYDSVHSQYQIPDKWCLDNPSWCSKWNRLAHYNVVYQFKIPEKPWVHGTIRILLDSIGHIITLDSVGRGAVVAFDGIPECLSNPSCYTFGIDSVMAITIAQKTGLKEGIGSWHINFGWDTCANRYTWRVENILTKLYPSGKGVLIDVNSGVVLSKFEWQQ